jgi:hypothetical protein
MTDCNSTSNRPDSMSSRGIGYGFFSLGESMKCHCGEPLHYHHPSIEAWVNRTISEKGPYVPVTQQSSGRTFLVQRHYMALHGIKEEELDKMGFEEVKEGGTISRSETKTDDQFEFFWKYLNCTPEDIQGCLKYANQQGYQVDSIMIPRVLFNGIPFEFCDDPKIGRFQLNLSKLPEKRDS